jgi:hypothetical protein
LNPKIPWSTGQYVYPTFHAAPSEYTGTGTAPLPATVAPNTGTNASDTKARDPAPTVAATGKVATVTGVVFVFATAVPKTDTTVVCTVALLCTTGKISAPVSGVADGGSWVIFLLGI